MKVAEDLKPWSFFTPRHFPSSTSVEAYSRPYDGSERGRTNSRVRQRVLSQQGGQGEQKVAKPLVAASLSLCNHPHQQTPPLQPAGPAAAPATRPRREGNELQNMPFIFQMEWFTDLAWALSPKIHCTHTPAFPTLLNKHLYSLTWCSDIMKIEIKPSTCIWKILCITDR